MINIIILVLVLVSGVIGAFGGAERTSKGWRRLGIPLLITIIALFKLHNWWVLSIMSR